MSVPFRHGGPTSRILQLTKVVNVPRSQTILQDAAGGKSSGPQAWASRFEVDIRDDKVIVTIKVRADIDDRLFQDNWRKKVAEKWSNRFMIKAKEQLYPIEVNLEKVTAGHHYDITVKRVEKVFDPHSRGHFGTEHMTEWGEHDTVNVPHEVGHMLGNLDEYGKIQRPDGVIRDYLTTRPDSIMGHSELNPLAKHYHLIEWAAKEELVALHRITHADSVETVPAVMVRRGAAAAAAAASSSSTTPSPVHAMARMMRETLASPDLRSSSSSSSSSSAPSPSSSSSSSSSSTTPPVKKTPVAIAPVTTTTSPPKRSVTSTTTTASSGGAATAATSSPGAISVRQQLHQARVKQLDTYIIANIESIPRHAEEWLKTHSWRSDPDLSAEAMRQLGLR